MSFNELWRNVAAHQGETFYTVTGLPFTYRISGDNLINSRTSYPLGKSNFEKVYDLGDISGPGEISSYVRGSAYVYAIMTDRRIKG